MKTIKKNINGILLCVFEIVVGILLLVDPVAFTTGIIAVFGILLLLAGLTRTVKYFRTDAQEAARSQGLTKGLLCLLAGAFCAFKTQWFVVTFPVLTLLYGVLILVTGVAKIQWMVDAIRQKKQKWFLAGLSAAVSLICGIVIVSSPFSTTAVLWMFTGISLIVEAVFDGISLVLSSRNGSESTCGEEEEEVSQ